jgi:ATP-dependent helicase/nuclease subunit B
VPEQPELDIEAEVEVPSHAGSKPLGLRGRIDRIDRLPGEGSTGRLRIADYKTSPGLGPLVETNNLLKGERPQLAVYYFLAGKHFPDDEIFEARVFGIGPEHPDPGADEDLSAPGLKVFGARDPAETWKAIGDTLHTLAGIAGAGRFPFRQGRHCVWCPYRPACRRNHPPTRARVETAPAYEDYYRLSKRTKTKVWGPKR